MKGDYKTRADLLREVETLRSRLALLEANPPPENEEMFSSAIENIEEVVWSLGPNPHDILYISPKSEAVTGFSPEAFQRDATLWLSLLHPEDKERAGSLFQSLLDQGRWEMEHRIVRSDGEVRWLHHRCQAVFDRIGKVLRYDGVTQDITARKLAERNLRKLHRRLTNVLESIFESFLTLDRDGNVTFINRTGEGLFRHHRDELLGKNLWEVYPHLRETLIYHEFMKAQAKQTPVLFETFLPEEDLWFHVRGYPSQDGLSVYAQNITETKRMQARLLKYEKERLAGQVPFARGLLTAQAFRDPFTARHQERVATLTVAIARVLGQDEEAIARLEIAALLHDIGTIAIPTEITMKPGILSPPEREILRSHTAMGHDILRPMPFPVEVALTAAQHHERLDGSGYPNGLPKNEIHFDARLVGLADVVEAMASHRPFRPALGLEVALEEITRHRGERYDAEMVDACMTVCRQFDFDFEAVVRGDIGPEENLAYGNDSLRY